MTEFPDPSIDEDDEVPELPAPTGQKIPVKTVRPLSAPVRLQAVRPTLHFHEKEGAVFFQSWSNAGVLTADHRLEIIESSDYESINPNGKIGLRGIRVRDNDQFGIELTDIESENTIHS